MSVKHTVSQGDCLSSITKKFGFSDYKTIYDDGENSDLKTKRTNPNVLFPGDIVSIPDVQLGEESGSTEQKHNFKIIRKKTFVRVVVKDSEDKPFANVDYDLNYDGNLITGKTDGSGKIEQEITADAKSGVIILRSKSGSEDILGVIELEFGALDPVEETTGVQARLNNLGFECGDVNGVMNTATKNAIKAFQKKNGDPETGNADDATRNKLRQQHDLG